VNNILNLYNIELKRIYKLYLGLLGFLLVGNIALVSNSINTAITEVARQTNSKKSIGLMKLKETKFILSEHVFSKLQGNTTLLLGLVVILCLIYGLVIWYRDFIGRNKTGYALFMLPQNKFNIYIAKAITLVIMIYGVMITQMLAWIIDISIIKVIANINNQEIISLLDIVITRNNLIQPYFIDFIMINVIGVILAVVVIFTGVMIQKSFKIPGVILGCLYIFGSIFLYGYVTSIANYQDQRLMIHAIYYIILFVISVGLSYILLNKKVYV
jgi:hypothetical protein